MGSSRTQLEMPDIAESATKHVLRVSTRRALLALLQSRHMILLPRYAFLAVAAVAR